MRFLLWPHAMGKVPLALTLLAGKLKDHLPPNCQQGEIQGDILIGSFQTQQCSLSRMLLFRLQASEGFKTGLWIQGVKAALDKTTGIR